MSASVQDDVPQQTSLSLEDSPPQASIGETTRDTQLSGLKRHSEELWFGDGNVILAASGIGFRVFRSLLAAQSAVFADMFASSSSDAEEMLEGCPVVHVSDTPEDVAHFLRVLLPTSQRIFFSRKFRFTFNQVSAIIRLAHKYNVPDILDQAITSLEDYSTADFKAWESGNNLKVIEATSQQAIGIINLARLVDRPTLLPTAFYMCALEGSSILDGYEHEDKSVEHLSHQDTKRCIDGRNKLVEEEFAIILEVFLPRPTEGCRASASCRASLQRMLEDAIKACKKSSACVLQGWDELILEWTRGTPLCALCEKAVIEREYKARKRVWDALPTIFDIKVDGWGSSTSGGDAGGTAAVAAT